MDILSSLLDVSCPICGTQMRTRLSDFQRKRAVRCRSGHLVQLTEDGNSLGKLDRSMRDLERSFRDLGGTIRFDI
jgi:hypothetical protein